MRTIQMLLEEFRNMEKLPLFEFETLDEGWETWEIYANDDEIYTLGYRVEWDSAFSLDEHLQELYSRMREDFMRDGRLL